MLSNFAGQLVQMEAQQKKQLLSLLSKLHHIMNNTYNTSSTDSSLPQSQPGKSYEKDPRLIIGDVLKAVKRSNKMLKIKSPYTVISGDNIQSQT